MVGKQTIKNTTAELTHRSINMKLDGVDFNFDNDATHAHL